MPCSSSCNCVYCSSSGRWWEIIASALIEGLKVLDLVHTWVSCWSALQLSGVIKASDTFLAWSYVSWCTWCRFYLSWALSKLSNPLWSSGWKQDVTLKLQHMSGKQVTCSRQAYQDKVHLFKQWVKINKACALPCPLTGLSTTTFIKWNVTAFPKIMIHDNLLWKHPYLDTLNFDAGRSVPQPQIREQSAC